MLGVQIHPAAPELVPRQASTGWCVSTLGDPNNFSVMVLAVELWFVFYRLLNRSIVVP